MSVSIRSNWVARRRWPVTPVPVELVVLVGEAGAADAPDDSSRLMRTISWLLDSVRLSMILDMDAILVSASASSVSLRLSDAAVIDSMVW